MRQGRREGERERGEGGKEERRAGDKGEKGRRMRRKEEDKIEVGGDREKGKGTRKR